MMLIDRLHTLAEIAPPLGQASSLWLNYLTAFSSYLLPLALIGTGFVIGRWREKLHFKHLDRREAELRHMVASNVRQVPTSATAQIGQVVIGQAVIASDYFKSFVAQFKKLLGGELTMFESLLERARREALIRMLEEAEQLGANQVINVRLQSSNIGSANSRNKVRAMAEVLAYGTAIFVPPAMVAGDAHEQPLDLAPHTGPVPEAVKDVLPPPLEAPTDEQA